MRRFIECTGLALFATACATAHLTPETLAQTESGVSGARQAGADGNPQAALRLKYATDELAQAKALDKRGEADDAKRMMDRAQADTELSLALTRETQAEALAKQAIGSEKSLEQNP